MQNNSKRTYSIELFNEEYIIERKTNGKFILPEGLKNVICGVGSNLKPAHEPILLARKPLSERNIAANVLKWGTGGINVDGCRIKYTNPDPRVGNDKPHELTNKCAFGQIKVRQVTGDVNKGRFPSNLCLECCCEEDEIIEGGTNSSYRDLKKDYSGDGVCPAISSSISKKGHEIGYTEKCPIHTNPNCVCRMLDEQAPETGAFAKVKTGHSGRSKGIYGDYAQRGDNGLTFYNDGLSGPSRFFYQAKASQKERWFYCTICKQAYPMKERDKHIHNAPEKEKYKYLEFHPTQKPESLISYLMRLITPPNGTVIDPFLGSGTAIIAAEREGFNCIGIDSKFEYCEIAYWRGKAEMIQQKIFAKHSTIKKEGF